MLTSRLSSLALVLALALIVLASPQAHAGVTAVSTTKVPEPGTFVIFAAALAGAMAMGATSEKARRNRRRD